MLVINPGTGPVDGATLENAVAAMEMFAAAVGVPDHERVPERDRDGRFGFRMVWTPTGFGRPPRECLVDMPGCDPMLTSAGTPWKSPRMYVDGSSWLWGFGVGIARGKLLGE